QNLISNAVEYSSPETAVRVVIETRGKEARIVVEDRGIGIPENDRKRIFEAFHRGSNARSARTGLCLSLHLALEIVRGHEGRLWFDSEVDRGTTFFMALPMA